jgi:hypothetical protein
LTRSNSRNLLAALLILVVLAVAVVLVAVPFSTPMGGFWLDAQQFAASGQIRSAFTPCGYPALLGLGLRFAGNAGVLAAQLLPYVLISVAIYLILRLLALSRSAALAGAGLLALDPDLVIDIKKIWDTNITTALLLLVCAALLVVMRRGLTPARAAVTGILWGLSMTVRPNFPALILPIAFAFWFAPIHADRVKTLFTSTTIALFGAALVVIAINTVVHGHFYIPQNGPYNFYAGDNAFTERALLANLNAEPSIYPSLLANGFSSDVDIYSPTLRPYYVQHALLYIRQNPLISLKLVLLKLGTLLRPDTKIYPFASLGGMVKVFLALAVPFWLITLIVFRGRHWGLEDWLFIMFVVAYVAPFLLTNSDPRFRTPLDILVLTHAIYRITRRSPLPSSRVASIQDGRHGFAHNAE